MFIQAQFEATQARFEVGEITRTDVAQAEARLSRSVSDRVQSEGNLISSRAAYARLVGSVPGTLEPAPRLRDLPESETNAIEIAMDNNPFLAAARSDEEASRHAIDVSRGRLLQCVEAAREHHAPEVPQAERPHVVLLRAEQLIRPHRLSKFPPRTLLR